VAPLRSIEPPVRFRPPLAVMAPPLVELIT
jgi:hypothetical protein